MRKGFDESKTWHSFYVCMKVECCYFKSYPIHMETTLNQVSFHLWYHLMLTTVSSILCFNLEFYTAGPFQQYVASIASHFVYE